MSHITRNAVLCRQVGGYYLAYARLTHTDYKRYCHSVLKIYRYLSHITNTAVLWRVVFGGRILHTPCFPRLQVIVIARSHCRLMGTCFLPFFMVKFLHFCTDVGLVKDVGQHFICHAVLTDKVFLTDFFCWFHVVLDAFC